MLSYLSVETFWPASFVSLLVFANCILWADVDVYRLLYRPLDYCQMKQFKMNQMWWTWDEVGDLAKLTEGRK